MRYKEGKVIFKERIISDPKILGGNPVIKGTRIPVSLILKLLSSGMSIEEIIDSYPEITKDDIMACLEYAAYIVSEEVIVS